MERTITLTLLLFLIGFHVSGQQSNQDYTFDVSEKHHEATLGDYKDLYSRGKRVKGFKFAYNSVDKPNPSYFLTYYSGDLYLKYFNTDEPFSIAAKDGVLYASPSIKITDKGELEVVEEFIKFIKKVDDDYKSRCHITDNSVSRIMNQEGKWWYTFDQRDITGKKEYIRVNLPLNSGCMLQREYVQELQYIHAINNIVIKYVGDKANYLPN